MTVTHLEISSNDLEALIIQLNYVMTFDYKQESGSTTTLIKASMGSLRFSVFWVVILTLEEGRIHINVIDADKRLFKRDPRFTRKLKARVSQYCSKNDIDYFD